MHVKCTVLSICGKKTSRSSTFFLFTTLLSSFSLTLTLSLLSHKLTVRDEARALSLMAHILMDETDGKRWVNDRLVLTKFRLISTSTIKSHDSIAQNSVVLSKETFLEEGDLFSERLLKLHQTNTVTTLRHKTVRTVLNTVKYCNDICPKIQKCANWKKKDWINLSHRLKV